jgi:hypothetical protein
MKSVLRIHDILVWIRIQIRICGSMPLTNGFRIRIRIRILDPHLLFSSLTVKMPTKKNFLFYFSCLLLLTVHLHHFSKIISQKESQNSWKQGFSYYFCMMIEGSGSGAGSGSIPLTNGSGAGSVFLTNWIRIREAQKHVDPVDPDSDPDPQH